MKKIPAADRRRFLMDEPIAATRLIQRAVRKAIEEHRRMGNPIAVLRDGKVVWIPPEAIPPYTPSDDE